MNVEEEEEIAELRRDQRTSRSWNVFGKPLPQSEIVFFAQIILIYAVVGVSLFNLSRGHGDSQLWTALLSSCLGYLLPNPSMNKK